MRSIHIILFLIVVFQYSGKSQIDLSPLINLNEEPEPIFKTDTVFYSPINGIQMIVIDHVGAWQRKIDYWEQKAPRALSYDMLMPLDKQNEYFFRDSTRKIIKGYNTTHTLSELTTLFYNIPVKNNFIDIEPYGHTNFNHFNGYNGYYKVYKNKYCGLIDRQGKIVIPFVYDDLYFIKNDKLLAKKNNKYGIINNKNKLLVPIQFDKIDGLYGAPENNALIYFLNNEKNIAVYKVDEGSLLYFSDYKVDWFSPAYDYYGNLTPFFITKKGDFYGLMDSKLKIFIPNIYEGIRILSNDNFLVEKNNKWGVVSKRNEIVVPIQYENVNEEFLYHDGNKLPSLLIFGNDGKYNVIYLVNENRLVKSDTLYGYISGYNSWCLNKDNYCNYSRFGYLVVTTSNNKHGLINFNGKVILPAIYDNMGEINGTKINVLKDGKEETITIVNE